MLHPIKHLLDSAFAHIESGAHQAATGHNSLPHPTPAQAAAGNYKLGRVRLHGLDIRIENVRNSVRSGVGEDGKPWESRMAAHYGYFAGTRGADGDPVDVFIGPFPESADCWVINQRNKAGGFDEHKVMAGFLKEDQARDAYQLSYSPGWTGLMSIVPATMTQVRWWLRHGDKSRPLSTDQLPYEGTPIMDKVLWNADAQPTTDTLPRILYALRSQDGSAGLIFDSMTPEDVTGDPDAEVLPMLDALVVEVGMLQRKMEQMKGVMSAAGGAVTVTDFVIADPVKSRGVLQIAVIFSMSDGQTVTVWFHNPDSTPAKLTPMDELITWKWQLNKMDVTIAVAPERGRDLNVREVGRRVMRLVERNSEGFKKANARAVERAAETQAITTEIATLETRLAELQPLIETARAAKIQRAKASAFESENPAWQRLNDEQLASAEGFQLVNDAGEKALLYWQDFYDHFFQSRYVAVRNALRSLGWTGENFGDLSKNGHTLEATFKQVGAGRNIVGMHFTISGVPGFFMSDTLTRSEQELAKAIDMGLPVAGSDPGEQADPAGQSGRASSEWVKQGMSEEQAAADKVSVLSRELAGVIREEAAQADFAASELPRVVQMWAEEQGVDADALKAGLISAIGDGFSEGRKRQILRALGAPVAENSSERVASIEQALRGLGWSGNRGSVEKWGALLLASPAGQNAAGGPKIIFTIGELTGGPISVADDGMRTHQEVAQAIDQTLVSADALPLGVTPDAIAAALNKGDTTAADFAFLLRAGLVAIEDGKGLPTVRAAEKLAQAGFTVWSDGKYHQGEEPAKPVGTVYDLGEALKEIGFVPATGIRWTRAIDGAPGQFEVVVSGGVAKLSARGEVLFRDGDPTDVQALIDRINVAVADYELDGEQAGDGPSTDASPSDAQIEAAAKAGAKIHVTQYNLALPKAERDALPKGTFSTEDGAVSVTLYTKDDLNRAKKAMDEAQEQSYYSPFDAAEVKMPTAVQLGLNKIGVMVMGQADGSAEPSPGWSNGHLLDLTSRPSLVESAVKKYHVDYSAASIRKVRQESIDRIADKARTNAATVEPIAFIEGDKIRAVVLADEASGTVVHVDLRYFAYFFKTYRGCEFRAAGPDDSVAVWHRGAMVGVVMPLRGASAQSLRRAIKANQPDPVTETPMEDLNLIAKVDAAYKFASATDRFKEYIADTVDEAEYSMFLTAKNMDESAKAAGASIQWDVEEGVVMDGVVEETASALFDAGDEILMDGVSYSVKAIIDESAPVNQRLFGARQVAHVDWGIYGGVALVEASDEDRREFGGGTFRIGKGQTQYESIVRVDPKGMRLYFIDNDHFEATGEPKWGDPVKLQRLIVQNKAKFEAAYRTPILDDAAILDAAEDGYTAILGRIFKDGVLAGRAVIGGDGKAMVFKGAEGTERVTFVSKVDGQVREAMWSDSDAAAMVGWLINPPAQQSGAGGDVAYREVDDMFTAFYPDSKAGEQAWAVINANPETSGGKVLTIHAESVAAQLRAAGYTVIKGERQALSDAEQDALLAELTGEPAASKKAPRRVTKAAAREAYDSLQWTVNDLRGHTNVELLRVDVPAALEPKMATVRDLMVSGWPDGATGDPDSLLASAQSVIDRWKRLNEDGLTQDMGRGEAWTYLTSTKGLTGEQADTILATPSSVTQVNVGGETIDRPSYTMAYLNGAADAARATPAPDTLTTQTSEAPMQTWIVTNTRGYRREHEAETMVRAIQEGMNAVDYTLESSEWTAVQVGGGVSNVVAAEPVAPAVETAPQVDPKQASDTKFLQGMIDGTVNLLDESIFSDLEPMFDRYADNPAMMDLLNRATAAYTKAAEEAARMALA